MLELTPTSGTARPLSLFVIPRACEGNSTSGTIPAIKYVNPYDEMEKLKCQVS